MGILRKVWPDTPPSSTLLLPPT